MGKVKVEGRGPVMGDVRVTVKRTNQGEYTMRKTDLLGRLRERLIDKVSTFEVTKTPSNIMFLTL